MTKCPNPDCFYSNLVLLPKRKSYKCAKCGKLYSQKEIELGEFIEENKRARQESRKQYMKEAKNDHYAKKIIPKLIEEIKAEKPAKSKEEYYEDNRDKIIHQKREYRKNLSGQARKLQNEKRKARRLENIDAIRLQSRINYWKQQQKQLALQFYENEVFKAYNAQFQNLLPTLLLS